jgi:hypothetical protein
VRSPFVASAKNARVRRAYPAADASLVRFSATAESLQGVSILNMTTQFGDLDVTFSPAGFPAGFESLHSSARPVTVAGLTMLVASLDDVIASKEAAGRDKDFEALPTLIKLRQQQQKKEVEE